MGEMFDEPVLDDYQDKYIVIKTEHAKDRLTAREKATLVRYLAKIANGNQYWVVNKDEPYAEQVRDLIRAAEAKKVKP